MFKKVPLFVAVCGALGFAQADDLDTIRRNATTPVIKDIRQLAETKQPYYIKYKSGKISTLRNSITALGANTQAPEESIRVIVAMMTDAQAEQLQKDNKQGKYRDVIEYIEPVPRERMMGDNIPYNIKQVQALNVWDTDRDGKIDVDAKTGEGVKVCIIDSGIDGDHDEFKQYKDNGTLTGTSMVFKVKADPADPADPAELAPWDEDDSDHGTHVAGTVLAAENNRGVIGVAPKVNALHIVRYFGPDGKASPLGLVTAINACKDAGADVVNMSLGGGGKSQANEEAFNEAYESGMLLVAAAGNDGNDVASYPASYDSIISVAALHDDEEAVYFSQTPPTQYDPNDPTHTDVMTHGWDTVELAGGGYNVISSVPHPNGELPDVGFYVEGDEYRTLKPAGSFVSKDVFTGTLVDGGDCQTADTTWSNGIVMCKREDTDDKPQGKIDFVKALYNALNSGAKGVVSYDATAGAYKPSCLDDNGVSDCPDVPVLIAGASTGKALLPSYVGKRAELRINDGSLECNLGPDNCSGGYTRMSGTSMASPTVAGTATLLWDVCGGPTGMTNKQLRQLLRAGAKDLVGRQLADASAGESESDMIDFGAGYDRVTGWGLPQISDSMTIADSLGITSCPKPKISVTPQKIEVCPSTDVTFDVTVDASLGKTFTFGLRDDFGGQASFSPTLTDSTTTLTFNQATSGEYELVMEGVDGADIVAIDATVIVKPIDVLEKPVLKAPLNGDDKVDVKGVLKWNAIDGVSDYDVIIARDAGFADIISTTSVTEVTSLALSGISLGLGETYYWKVIAKSPCGGTDSESDVFNFTTEVKVCAASSLPIPDESSNRVVSEIDVPASMISSTKKIKKLMLDSKINVYPVKGTIAELVRTDSLGNEHKVTLVNRPSSPNCIDRTMLDLNIDMTLDDTASVFAKDHCETEFDRPYLEGTLKADEPLSVFADQPFTGKWTLRVSTMDNNPYKSILGDNSLEKWCLSADVSDVAQMNFMKPFDVGEINYNDAVDAVVLEEGGADSLLPYALFGSSPKTYSLYSDSTNGAFKLDTSGFSPKILVADAAKLQEAKSPARVSIMATDADGNIASTIVEVTIIDSPNVNKAPDLGGDKFERQIADNIANGDIVMSLNIADPDDDPFNLSILSGNDNGVFALNGTQLVIADNSTIDITTTPSYTLNLEAKDEFGNASNATIIINLFDHNELPTDEYCSADNLDVVVPMLPENVYLDGFANNFQNMTDYGSHEIEITNDESIDALSIDVNVDVDWSSDLVVNLVNEAGDKINLISMDINDYCSASNVNVSLNKWGMMNYAEYCNDYGNGTGKFGQLIPVQSLELFNGKSLKGKWQLQLGTAFSSYSDTSGKLNKWCIKAKSSAPNHAPSGSDQTLNSVEGDVIDVDVSAYFTDADSDAFTVSIADTLPTGITLVNGKLTGTLATDTAGTHTLIIKADDGKTNGVGELTLTWTITEPVVPNTPPVLTGVAKDLNKVEGDTLNVDVNAFFKDDDGDVLTITVTGALPDGVTFANGKLTGTLASGSTGTYTLVFTASDGQADVTQELSVTVLQPKLNTPPVVAKPPFIDNVVGDDVSVDLASYFNDVDGDKLSLTVEGALPKKVFFDGKLVTGTLTEAGKVEFTVTVNDGNGGQYKQVFTWTVKAKATDVLDNIAPVLIKSAYLKDEIDSEANVDFNTYFLDKESDKLTMKLTGRLPLGLVLLDGKVSGKLEKVGSYEFDLLVSDGVNEAEVFSFVWDVTEKANHAPTIIENVELGYKLSNGQVQSVSVDLNKYVKDEDGDALSITVRGLSPDGLTINENGMLIGAVSTKLAGINAFSAIVKDGKGGTVTLPIKIQVSVTGIIFGSDFE